MKKIKILLLITFGLFFLSSAAYAQAPANNPIQSVLQKTALQIPSDELNQPNVITKLAVLTGVALLPFLVLLLTSFIKFIVVLQLMRNALGVQQTPPNQVLTGISLILTIYVMFPTGIAMYNASEKAIKDSPPEIFSGQSALYIINVVDQAKEPFRTFLQKNVIPKHAKSFYQIAYKIFPEPYKGSLSVKDFIILIPSFITSQLKMAFEIGVLIYLPFFVIDLVTSNILLAMGMMMLSPLTISLPIKLLLLVIIDGWTILMQGLVLTFK